jgi:hypothetical protein
MKTALIAAVFGTAMTSLAADLPTEAGQKAMQQACVPCHSLRLIESQRLSEAAWKKEISKMIGWGAVVLNQQVLLDYLAKEYSDTKPMPAPARSADSGANKH